MNNRTKYLKYGKETAKEVMDRDRECLFCRLKYHTEGQNLSDLEFNIFDIAHFINRSQGGLGVKENLILLCRWHHSHFDNSNKSYRQEMQQIAEDYLITLYPNLDISKLVYQKYGDWFYIEKGEVKLKEDSL